MSKDPYLANRFGDQTGVGSEEFGHRPSCHPRRHTALVDGVSNNAALAPQSRRERENAAPDFNPLPGVLLFSIIWIVPILACGSFQPRPTPTAQPVIVAPAQDTPNPAQELPTAAPTQPPPPTATANPSPTVTVVITNPLSIGDPARITADTGLNIREQPSTGAPVVVLLARGKRVLVLEGPAASDGFIWWKVDDNQGNIGWLAGGDGREEWVSPQLGDPRPVNRSPIVGDRVVVTLVGELSVRALPGVSSVLVARARTNEQFSVVAGPQAADNYFWYQIRSDNGSVEGWAADGLNGERWLTPLE